uniref:Uncharacterized protein n=1 Tax=Arundo donax TaxID=35708 RepID=A0A0A9EU36_ARUDO
MFLTCISIPHSQSSRQTPEQTQPMQL